jgi:hypothetical protein
MSLRRVFRTDQQDSQRDARYLDAQRNLTAPKLIRSRYSLLGRVLIALTRFP